MLPLKIIDIYFFTADCISSCDLLPKVVVKSEAAF